MSGPRPFGPDELAGVEDLDPAALAAETRLARDLEALAGRDTVAPTPGFAGRVMTAVAAEPLPAPAVAAGSALRHAAPGSLLVALRDALRVTLRGGFPAVVRAQALVLVLLAAGLAAGTGYAAAGALGLLGDRGLPGPGPEVPLPTRPSPGPTATPAPTLEATPTGSPEPTETPEPAETDDGEASEEPEESEIGGAGAETATPRVPSRTARPTARPTPRPTARPTRTPSPTEDPEDPEETPHPSETPEPTHTPHPTATPGHT